MLYASILHSLAGAVTGSVFKVRTLLLLLAIVLIETTLLAVVNPRTAGLWALTNFVAIQIGYFAGVLGRRALEQAGYSLPPVGVRWPQ